ncbi:MT domain-containing protein [Caenorhabditis elegans]|uniref:MT domain-containing protein n=1 Tax=Caenorhabditis elegans TaxID=6239 RepID=Q9XU21_CAEEL|nr:MT domain-containing protein [Caenorhabditis elegans]CAB07227.3 MT domain-containing protein [Caenorhabditis elegans]
MNVPVGYVEALVGDLQEINRQKDVEIEDLEQQKEADVAEIAALRAELDFHQNIADKLLKVNEDMKEISKKKVRIVEELAKHFPTQSNDVKTLCNACMKMTK